MGERILIPGAASNSATSSTSSSNGTNGNMIHAGAASSAAAAARAMDRPGAQEQQQQHPPQQALKCPRCDSTNTKFCYYNNYSLSQPRHFCKACKRYWTRGGTLRNVPVGGGCRKNKRVKKPTNAAARTPTASDHAPPPASLQPYTTPLQPLSLPGHSSHLDASISPLFYSLPTSGAAVSSAFASSLPHSVSISCTPYDLQPQLSSLGLGFSNNQREDDFSLAHLQNSSAAISLMHDYSLFGSSLSSATAASLLVSSLKQPKKAEEYHGLLSYEDLPTNGNLGVMKEVKSEGVETNVISSSSSNGHRVEWQIPPHENSFDAVGFGGSTTAPNTSHDSSYLYWNPAVSGWPDAANCGSSVAPLI